MSRAIGKNEVSGLSISTRDQTDIQGLYDSLRRGKAQLISPEGKGQRLPASVNQFLTELLALLNQGKPIHIIQNQATLTTVDAAALIGVSRQYLVNLLERGEIPHHLVGTHRRIYARDLFVYKAKRDSARKSALRDLVKSEAAEGLYTRHAEGV